MAMVVWMETGVVRTGCHRGGGRRRLGLRPAVVGGTWVGAEPEQFVVELKKIKRRR